MPAYLLFIKCLLLFILSAQAIADTPWFTGPLLAIPGKTIPRGHAFLVNLATYTEVTGRFNQQGRRTAGRHIQTFLANPLLSYGLTDSLDVQFNIPYIFKRTGNSRRQRIGDVSVLLGYQLLSQKEALFKPNLRVTVQEIFPTGSFLALNPANEGADGTGLGSYQTNFGFNFQHLLPLQNSHYLRTRLNFNYLYAQKTSIRGPSVFGGTAESRGQARPGNLYAVDLSTEYTLTKNWVLVMESYYFSRRPTRFKGFPGILPSGRPAQLESGTEYALTLAPAIEYNFSERYGMIAGVWFPVQGKNTPVFLSTMIAFNAYW